MKNEKNTNDVFRLDNTDITHEGDCHDDIKSTQNAEESKEDMYEVSSRQGEDNLQKSCEDSEGLCKNTEDLGFEGEASRKEVREETKGFSFQGEANGKQREDNSEETERYSRINFNTSEDEFTPPMSGIHYGGSEMKKDGKSKSPSKVLVPIVAVLCVAAFIIFGLFVLKRISDAVEDFYNENQIDDNIDGVYSPDNTDGVVSIVKNNGGVKIDESISSDGKAALSIVGVVEKAAASVVEVSTLENSNYGQYVSSGAGSGVIVAKGENWSYIVTNYHVVGGSDRITVRLTDEREYEAVYIDGDESMDIAVIKIPITENVVMAEIGSSDALRVGEGVVAIGNPLGELGGTVTDGIISALDREITIDGHTMTLLQTNAAVNPGNSGGGLFNMAGELVGIVNAKKSSEGIEGLAFAIPIDKIYEDIVDVIEDGYIHGRITFGFEVVELTQMEAYANRFGTAAGLYVVSTENGNFSLKDRIVSVNSVSVYNEQQLIEALSGVKIGDSVVFGVSKYGGGSTNVTVTAKEYIPSGVTTG